MNKSTEEFIQRWNKFREEWPIERLKTMTLDEYLFDENTPNSFCYILERGYAGEGGGIGEGKVGKFGIYKISPGRKRHRAGEKLDGQYCWYEKFGETAESAFETIRSRIVEIAEFASAGTLGKIDDIDFMQMLKWKIAFMYQPDIQKPIVAPRFGKVYLKNHFPEIPLTPRSQFYKTILAKVFPNNVFDYEVWLNRVEGEKEIQDSAGTQEESDSAGTDNISPKVLEIVELLKTNRNVILHGAPGTGKTHFAREKIAKAMNAEVAFVQFHPSYDYSDFVEGLRPISVGSGQIGFERKDGIFKEFCARALENFRASEKYEKFLQKQEKEEEPIQETSGIQTEFSQERNWEKILKEFLNFAVTNKEMFLRKRGEPFFINSVSSDFENVNIMIPKNNISDEVRVKFNDLLKLLSANKDFETTVAVTEFLRHRPLSGRQDDGCSHAIIKKIRESLENINFEETQNLPKIELTQKILEQPKHEKVEEIQEVERKNFVFIIDEINRGEVSKIFGELFFSIDPGYRGKDGNVKTQYQNLVPAGDTFAGGFFVPENVYIIGTMNDIDRSVESMDFAFRRRFAWKEISADENLEMLDGNAWSDDAKICLKNLNAEIEKDSELGKSFQIGLAYFLKLKDYNGDFEKLWKFHLEGLLREYLRGRSDAGTKLEALKKAFDQETESASKNSDPAEDEE